MSEVDLNEVREKIKRAQRRGTPYPADAQQRVSVGREGQIYVGDTPSEEPVSRVHHGTFANGRLARDQVTARRKLPVNTVYVDEPDVRGWIYSVTTELSDTFKLFAYFDGTDYKVKLIEPELEGRVPAHSGHLFNDGKICLSERRGSGETSLEEAYSKSVLWALGMSYYLRGHGFPFSINNESD